MYNELCHGSTYEFLSFEVTNVDLPEEFFNKLSTFTVERFEICFYFTGNYMECCKVLPKGIKDLSIQTRMSLDKHTINAICKLSELVTLRIGGYINISLEDLHEILLQCNRIETLGFSYPRIDRHLPVRKFENVKYFKCVKFDYEETIDLSEWFPRLETLNVYMADAYNINNIHKLECLHTLNMKCRQYKENHAVELDEIYPQLVNANIMLETGGVRSATTQEGSARWPLKGTID